MNTLGFGLRVVGVLGFAVVWVVWCIGRDGDVRVSEENETAVGLTKLWLMECKGMSAKEAEAYIEPLLKMDQSSIQEVGHAAFRVLTNLRLVGALQTENEDLESRIDALIREEDTARSDTMLAGSVSRVANLLDARNDLMTRRAPVRR